MNVDSKSELIFVCYIRNLSIKKGKYIHENIWNILSEVNCVQWWIHRVVTQLEIMNYTKKKITCDNQVESSQLMKSISPIIIVIVI